MEFNANVVFFTFKKLEKKYSLNFVQIFKQE